MRKFVLIIVLFIFSACNTLSDAGKVMRNEKKSSTDEFLVEKRKTLVLPPDYNEIPEPGSLKKNNNGTNIKEILKAPSEKITNKNKSSNLEKSILENIRK